MLFVLEGVSNGEKCDFHHDLLLLLILLGGDFLTFLRKRKDDIKLKQLVKFSLDVASGMSYLESKNCIHR